DEGNGYYNCSWTVPLALSSELYDVRLNVSEANYNSDTNLFLDEFEIITDIPVLVLEAPDYEDDGGWGEEWSFWVNLNDSNIGDVNVSLYFSTDNVSWVLQDTVNETCPCTNAPIEFWIDEAWNESYIGTSYFQFRADDYHLGLDNVSASEIVLKDDTSSTATSGVDVNLDRNGSSSVSLEVTISDIDNDGVVDAGTSCGIWVTTDGVNYGARNDGVTTGNVCSYNFDPDTSYTVGPQNFIGGVSGDSDYNDANSSVASLTLIGSLISELSAPLGGQEYDATDVIDFRWNVTGDAGELVPNADDLSVEIVNTVGGSTTVCNFGQINNEGAGWYNCSWTVPLAFSSELYDVRINSSEQYYNNQSDLFLDEFEIVTDVVSLTGITFVNEDDGGWGEEWNFSVDVSDSNTGNVDVDLYFSTDNSSWVLQNSTTLVCPCASSEVKFVRDSGWNETYIGTSYFQFRADDLHLGFDNTTAEVN
ncbi:MAG: hypothetical protein KAS66_13040, partial [Candidatus Omnitrophica bacterium]|nr:hypothetical protein [Candidatus Omnitrophota bacterium]